jgi:hypothetical protein
MRRRKRPYSLPCPCPKQSLINITAVRYGHSLFGFFNEFNSPLTLRHAEPAAVYNALPLRTDALAPNHNRVDREEHFEQ